MIILIMLITDLCKANPDAKRLFDDLLSSYNKLVHIYHVSYSVIFVCHISNIIHCIVVKLKQAGTCMSYIMHHTVSLTILHITHILYAIYHNSYIVVKLNKLVYQPRYHISFIIYHATYNIIQVTQFVTNTYCLQYMIYK